MAQRVLLLPVCPLMSSKVPTYQMVSLEASSRQLDLLASFALFLRLYLSLQGLLPVMCSIFQIIDSLLNSALRNRLSILTQAILQ